MILLFLFSFVSFSFAQSEEVTGTCGGDCHWKYIDGILTISGTGTMDDYGLSGMVPWYNYKSSITEVIIEKGLTYIGQNAFYDCTLLKNVSLYDSIVTF